MDPTETMRQEMVGTINSQVESNSDATERARLEDRWGKVWDTGELCEDFDVKGFAAPYVVVQEKATGVTGTLMFQDWPRFYFSWKETG